LNGRGIAHCASILFEKILHCKKKVLEKAGIDFEKQFDALVIEKEK